MGPSGILCRVSGSDVDTLYEIPRHDRARCATILKKTTKRARRTAHMHTAPDGTPRHGVVAHLFARAALLRHLRCRSTEAKRVQEAFTFARLSRCGYLWLLGCVIIRPEPRGNQWRASIGHRRKYHKVNKTVTEISLLKNNIGDAGAIALAESFKATLVMKIPPCARDTVLGARAKSTSQETLSHLRHVSVQMLFCGSCAC